VRIISSYADAVIVGSAIIKKIEENLRRPDMLQKIGSFICELKKATLPA
jgi:tryptophan synthase alpha subunit